MQKFFCVAMLGLALAAIIPPFITQGKSDGCSEEKTLGISASSIYPNFAQ